MLVFASAIVSLVVASDAAAAEPTVRVDVELHPGKAAKGDVVHVTAVLTARDAVEDVEVRFDVPPCAQLVQSADRLAIGALRRGERRKAEFNVVRTADGPCLIKVFAFYPDDRVRVNRDGELVEVVVTGTPSALDVPLDALKRKLKLP